MGENEIIIKTKEIDETKISLLNYGGVPIYEPNLAPLIKKNVSAGRLTFTTDLEKAVKESKVIFQIQEILIMISTL